MSNAFDSVNYPTREPDRLVIGDRWTWKRADLTDYPVASYALTYSAVALGSGKPSKFAITASESGSDYIVEVGSATTADYEPGDYAWTAYITRSSDSERIGVSSGTWMLCHDLAATESDTRTFAQQQVDRIESVIAGLSSRQHTSYSLGGRSVTLHDLPTIRRELLYWQRVRSNEVEAERMSRGGKPLNYVRAKFQ